MTTPSPTPPLKADFTFTGRIERAATEAARAEAHGADGVLVNEMRHDAFLQLALAAGATRRADLVSGVAIAFARNPMTVATAAYDVQRLSGGRMTVGLGSQVKPHITHRYGMPWSRPAARMKEFAGALRAIWHSWQTGERLRFRGEFYTHTLMTPMFDPGPLPSGPPRIWLAGVGPLMTAVAGEVADGLICHALTSADYLRQVTLPAVHKARESSEHAGQPFDVVGNALVATGRTQEEYAAALTATRERIAFYASTPAYRAVLDLHGWGELHDELHRLSVRGRWSEMGRLVDDDVLDAFALHGEPREVGRAVRDRFAGLCTRVTVSLSHDADDTLALDVLAGVRD
ncbi:TIGR03617 family F420-dependent LLM class oxidoreductase [Streptomyces sp. PA03-1a]|nr:TIGR03617 family F420-dependent LLM class oxidoreductase [Streptomyces sp. PA03-1a]MDX2813122.1 TIGR03617 family F420-dependent LLM class oxidoreductase [Streptomyces sp. PA03-5A]